jgi:hypothetical protein
LAQEQGTLEKITFFEDRKNNGFRQGFDGLEIHAQTLRFTSGKILKRFAGNFQDSHAGTLMRVIIDGLIIGKHRRNQFLSVSTLDAVEAITVPEENIFPVMVLIGIPDHPITHC